MKKNLFLPVVAAWAAGLLGSHAIGSFLLPQDPHWYWGDLTAPPSLEPASLFEPHTRALAEEVNNNFCRIIEQIDGPIQTSLDDYDNRLTVNEAELLDHEGRIHAAEGRLDGHDSDIAGLGISVGDLQGRTSILETRMGAAETAVADLQGRVTVLESDTVLLGAQVDALEGRMTVLEDFMLNVAPVMHGEAMFDTIGSHAWTVPAQVGKLSLTVVGAGGGSGAYGLTRAPGGDGASIWMQEIAVTPGEVLTIEIGAGGVSIEGFGLTGDAGGASSVTAVSGSWSAAGGGGGKAPDGPLSSGTPGSSPAPHQGYAFRESGQGSTSPAAGGDGVVILRW